MTNQIQPVFILPEGTNRNTGKNAQKANIYAAKAVAETVRSTLGPKGMDKMLVDGMGDVVITNDGVTILEEMEIEHPAAKMIVEIAKVQEEEVGDGTTTAVILGGDLLKNAEALLDKNIHPTVIANGYELAATKAQEFLQSLAKKVDIENSQVLENLAKTAMTGKNVAWAKDKLSTIAVKATQHILEKSNDQILVDIDNIKIEKKEGGSSEDSSLIEGLVIDKERVHAGMPRQVKNAKIALIDSAIEVKTTETDAKISITDPSQLQAFIDQEEIILKKMVEKIVKIGATALFCQKGIDDMAQHYLAKKGVYAIRRVKKSDMEKLAKATNGRIVTNIDDLETKDLGDAGIVSEKKLGSDSMTFVEKCKNPKAVSIIVRGGTEHIVDEVERALKDAIGDIAAAITTGYYVCGGGAIEIELSKKIREYADSLSGREQLAVQTFAETLELIPRTLAENSGFDPIDILTELKAKHDKESNYGLNALTGKIENMELLGIIEPLKIKTQAIKSATGTAIMLLRIDDIISAGKLDKMPPGAGMPGPHGM
jgi:thermosome